MEGIVIDNDNMEPREICSVRAANAQAESRVTLEDQVPVQHCLSIDPRFPYHLL